MCRDRVSSNLEHFRKLQMIIHTNFSKYISCALLELRSWTLFSFWKTQKLLREGGGGGAQGELIMSYSMAGLFWAFIILPARPYLSFSRTELPVLPLLDLEEKFILWRMVEINSNPNILALQSTHHRVFAINHSHCVSRNISFSKIKYRENTHTDTHFP